MSRRTSEASKAVRIAWLKEQELVSKGKGTRDWTPDQQKEILELGKAYYHSDDPNDINDGKAFEGHHMKSAEAFPEYQGDPENIQFLSRSEHQAAHGGDYRNPTNGYFNPVTKNTQDFGQDKYEPCEIIELSEPVISSGNPTEPSDEKKEIFQNQENEKNLNKEQQKDNPLQRKVSTPIVPTAKPSSVTSKSFGGRIVGVIGMIKDFSDNHPTITEIIKVVAVAAVGVMTSSSSRSNRKKASYSSPDGGDNCSSDYDIDFFDSDDYSDSSDERSSPKEHTVPAHGQHYHTKDGVIWKEKESYQRGGKHNDG